MLLGVAASTMKMLAEREDLYFIRSTGTGRPSLLDLVATERLAERKQRQLTKGAAAQRLGIGRPALDALLASDVLAEIPQEQRVDRNGCLWIECVDRLIRDFHRAWSPGGKDRKLTPLGYASTPIASICGHVLAGRLRPREISSNGEGIGVFLFDNEELKPLMVTDRETLSLPDAAAALGVDLKNLMIWIKHRFIATEVAERRNGLRVRPEEINQFRNNYVTVTELAKRLGTRSFAASLRLEKLGCSPLIAGARTALYLRANVTEDLLQRFVGNPKRAEQPDSAALQAIEQVIVETVAKRLRTQLWQRERGYFGETRGMSVVVAIGRWQRYHSRYVFRSYPAQRAWLEDAIDGWLALGFVGLSSCLLLPWSQATSLFGVADEGEVRFMLTVDEQGNVIDPRLAPFQISLSGPRRVRNQARVRARLS